MLKKLFLTICLFISTFSLSAQQEGFIGEVKMFAGNFAPRGWALCDGQLLSIAQNEALFSILGTTYGGDGRTTFALPDLRGGVPVGHGTAPGLAPVQLGQKGYINSSDESANKISTTGVHYIICISGIYPSRQ